MITLKGAKFFRRTTRILVSSTWIPVVQTYICTESKLLAKLTEQHLLRTIPATPTFNRQIELMVTLHKTDFSSSNSWYSHTNNFFVLTNCHTDLFDSQCQHCATIVFLFIDQQKPINLWPYIYIVSSTQISFQTLVKYSLSTCLTTPS